MVLRKVFKIGRSIAVVIPKSGDYQPGDFVDIEVNPVEIRKINKDASKKPESMHRYSNGLFYDDFIQCDFFAMASMN